MNDAEKFWNDHYTQTPLEHRGEPSLFLQRVKHRLQIGKTLDIAMGEGRNAVFLAQQGFAVKGFDISQIAIDHATQYAQEQKVVIEAKKADLDLFIMGIMEYDTIIMTFFKPAITRYYYEMIRTLKQGGTILIESYMTDEIKGIISKDEAYKNYYFNSNEILFHLKGMKILYYQEDIISGKHTVQCLAQKPIDKDAAKYNLFDMSSKQVNSGPSHQRKLAEAFFKKTTDDDNGTKN